VSDPYSTHLPVLKGLSEFVPMRKVLEFGAGNHSTAFFLKQPKLDFLVSVETNPDWMTAAKKIGDGDGRFKLLTDRPPVGGYDLIFVDDGQSNTERKETLRWVFGGDYGLVAVHDAEEYEREIRDDAGFHFLFRFETPSTALCWPEKPDLDLTALAERVAELTP
jgi:hypothetical protein